MVDHIDNALAVARKYNQTLRIVTCDGELINPGGALTGGAYRNSSNLLGRKRELDELKEKINQLKATAETAAALDESLKTNRENLRTEIEQLNTKLQEQYLSKNTLSLNIEQVSARLEESERAFASIKKEIDELNKQIAEINNNKDQLEENNKKHQAAQVECEKRIEELEVLVEKAQADLVNANDNVSKFLVEYNSIKQKDDFILENIRRIRMEDERLGEELSGYTAQVETAFAEITNLENQVAILKGYIEKDMEDALAKENLLSDYNKNRDEMNANHKEFFAKREELTEKIAGYEKAIYKLDTSIEKNTEKSDELADYMWMEYELTASSAEELRDPDLTDLTSLKKEVTAVKAKIKSLGDVNVNAIEDYKEVSERYEFLKTQHDDIVEAERNLLDVIDKLNTSMQQQFAEKFGEIQVMFDKVFKELFGGGKGALELVDDTDLLETGIRIIAQPPGKKLQNMMQLSGGEKSLTAIALLFAIQSLKPSPFCLLDEIEAALDDSNVKRFAKYLDRLTKDTQFIVISHRKGTMEAADILYGITMQEKGVSTLVSVNMVENELDN